MHLTHAAEMAEEQVRDAARDCGTLPVRVQSTNRSATNVNAASPHDCLASMSRR